MKEGEKLSISTICPELIKMANDDSYNYNLDAIDCSCGDIASPTFIDKKFIFNGKTITVKNVPALKCKRCNELYSDIMIDLRVEQQAFKAMQENKSEIEF